jgi:4-carboxymuconolactone decarboxylase
MSRLGPIRPEDMDDAQRAVFDGITGGPRAKGDPAEMLNEEGALRGPFNAMLRSPEIGDLVQQLGGRLRYHSGIPDDLRELAILVCGRRHRANFEWYAHEKIARKVGVPEAVIQQVMDEVVPDDPRYATVYRFVFELQTSKRIDDELYKDAIDLMGEKYVVELVMLAGYYATVSHILNAFEVGLPSGEPLPFPD